MVDLTTIDAAHREVADALDEMVKGLRETIKTLANRVEEVEAERDALKERLEITIEEDVGAMEAMESVLLCVRYWLHDILYTNKPSPCPRTILRRVEEVL